MDAPRRTASKDSLEQHSQRLDAAPDLSNFYREGNNASLVTKEFAMSPLPTLDRFLPLETVLDLTGLSRYTLYRKIAAGTFPNHIKFNRRCCRWRQSEIALWQRDPIGFKIGDLPPIGS